MGIDILGLFLTSTGQRKFIIMEVDYFSKWVEAESLAIITYQKIIDFIYKSIVCRFGILKMIIVDNGKQFDSKKQ